MHFCTHFCTQRRRVETRDASIAVNMEDDYEDNPGLPKVTWLYYYYIKVFRVPFCTALYGITIN